MTITVKMEDKPLAIDKADTSADQVIEDVLAHKPAQIEFKDYGDLPQEIKISMAELLKGVKDTPTEKLTLTEEGIGRLYYTARLKYAPKVLSQNPILSGFEVRREYTLLRDKKWEILKDGDILKKGDLVRVNLFVMLPGDRTFVVVDDPIPGCLEPVDKKLATTSLFDAGQVEEKPAQDSYWYTYTDWVEYAASRWSFYHQELRHDSARFYADYLPKGNYLLSFVAQVIADGTFSANPTQVLEMYNPETFGKTALLELQVEG